jgi:two-component system cell cycle response regulator
MSALDPRILVIDDDKEARDLYVRYLRRQGVDAQSEADGHVGLRRLQDEHFDLVMLDIVMPGLSGLEVLAQIRRQFSSEELAVMIVSGYSEVEYILDALKSGATDYVLKPLGLDVMYQRIMTHLRFQRAMNLLRQSEQRARETLVSMPDLVFRLNPSGVVSDLNREPDFDLAGIFERSKRAVDGIRVTRQVRDALKKVGPIAESGTELLVTRIYGPSASSDHRQCFEIRVVSHSLDGFVCIARDVTFADRQERALLELVGTDPLTKIANRRRFDEVLKKEWRRQLRDKKPLSLIMIDIDHFKKLNDSQGHLVGDKCLITIASAMESLCLRPGDTAARYGGEEFAIILPETELDGASVVADRIREAIASLKIPLFGDEQPETVTVSVGVSEVVPGLTSSSEDLVKQADRALYEAKEAGRNRVHRAVPSKREVI